MNVLRRITRSTLSLTAAAMLLCTAMPTAERKAFAWAADGKVLGVTNSVKEKGIADSYYCFHAAGNNLTLEFIENPQRTEFRNMLIQVGAIAAFVILVLLNILAIRNNRKNNQKSETTEE